MSVEYCVIRLAPQSFAQIQQNPNTLADRVDSYYSKLLHKEAESDCVDSRAAYKAGRLTAVPALRMLHIDEFTTSLLVSFMEDQETVLFEALVGWGTSHSLAEASYGYGQAHYYAPEEVKMIVARLNSFPDSLLEARFSAHAEQFRLASAGYFADDSAILEHQRRFAELLRRFYREAAQEGNFVLLLIV